MDYGVVVILLGVTMNDSTAEVSNRASHLHQRADNAQGSEPKILERPSLRGGIEKRV